MIGRMSFFILLSLLLLVPFITGGISQAEQSATTTPATSTPPANTAKSSSAEKTTTGHKTPVQKPVLSPEQQAKIDQIEKQYQQDLVKLKQTADAKLQQVKQLLRDPRANDDVIKAAMYQYSNARADMQLARIFAQRAKARVVNPNSPTAAVDANKSAVTSQSGAKAESGGGCTSCGAKGSEKGAAKSSSCGSSCGSTSGGAKSSGCECSGNENASGSATNTQTK
jgi:Spy/CpxP family protein refolding chaperone